MIDKKGISQRLLEVAMSYGSRSEFARQLGIKPQDLTDYFKGKTTPGTKLLARIEAIGGDVDYIMGKKEKAEEDPPYLYGVSAGYFTPVFDDIKDRFNTYFLRKRGVIVLRVNGHSMKNIGIEYGDDIVVDTTTEKKEGSVVLAKETNGMTVKRLANGELKPENDLYEPLPLWQAINAVGVVTHIIKKVH